MGNENSSFIYINTNSLNYLTGESIRGEIYVKILDPSNLSQSLTIKITGEEYSEVQESLVVQKTLHPIINYEQSLYSWSTPTPKQGDYAFSFKFKLPKNIPGSTYLDLSGMKAYIQYKIQAFISPELFHSINIQIRPSQCFEGTVNQVENDILIKSCYCIVRNITHLIITANKHEYACNDVIKICFDKVLHYIPRVLCRLCRTVTIGNDLGAIKVFKDIILETETNENHLDIDLKSLEGRISNQSSTSGKKVTCSYSLSFSPVVNAFCASYYPDTTLDVFIYPQPTAPVIPRYSMPWSPENLSITGIEDSNLDDDN
jgi:Arrestin (or S-antigen), N-terminal domain